MIRAMYNWTLKQAASKHATWSLAAVSFAESSFFPIPPDALLVPMCLANRKKIWFYATVCTLASVLGGVVGYLIGYLLYESVGLWLITLYGLTEKAGEFKLAYAEYGAAIILLKGLTPIPYKLVTIVSGLASYPILPFIVLSILTRGARFFLLAGLIHLYGEPIRAFIEKYLELVSLALLAIIILGFVSVKYLF